MKTALGYIFTNSNLLNNVKSKNKMALNKFNYSLGYKSSMKMFKSFRVYLIFH